MSKDIGAVRQIQREEGTSNFHHPQSLRSGKATVDEVGGFVLMRDG